MAEAKKVLIWVGGVCAVVGGVGAIAWVGTGFAAGHREAATAYKEIEALGIPLDADAFLASFSPKPSENCAEELLPALADLKETDDSLSPETQNAAGLFVWTKADGAIPIAERTKAHKSYQKSMDRVRAASKKPYCVKQQSWADSVTVTFPELASFRLAVKITCSEAVSAAAYANRKTAVKRLNEAVHYGNLVGQTPTLIHSLVHIALNAITMTAFRECIIADPAGASTYATVLEKVKLRPFGYAVRGEAFFTAAMYRNYSLKDMSRMMESLDETSPKPIKNPKKAGLPDDPVMRAYMGYAFTRWLPVLSQLNRDGSAKDKAAFDRELVKLESESANFKGPIGIFHNIVTPVLTQARVAETQSQAQLAVAGAFAKVAIYRNRNGSYPKTLSQAGVTKTDPFSDKNKPLGYSVKDGQMRIWSIGRNKGDDQGRTFGELVKSDPSLKESNALQQGDIVFVMRPPGTMVHP